MLVSLNYLIVSQEEICVLSGGTLLGVCYTQDLGIILVALFAMSVARYVSYLLVTNCKGEIHMKNMYYQVGLYASSVLETLWAVGVSFLVGISLSPIIHKYKHVPMIKAVLHYFDNSL